MNNEEKNIIVLKFDEEQIAEIVRQVLAEINKQNCAQQQAQQCSQQLKCR